jgi:protein-S-isoprenylcysteine O-methyltransferase
MKAKIISITAFILLAYALPLLGNSSLLVSPQLGVLALFAAILFATQPPLRLSEARKDNASDRHSIIFILAAFLLSQLAIILEWGYFHEDTAWRWDLKTIAGLLLMVVGTALRVWSIRTLGRFFTATVRTQEHQQIITGGAYRIVRHPSYSGAFLAALGSALFMHTMVAMAFTALALLLAYNWRIKAEEKALLKEFGKEYRMYRKRTRKLVPFFY